ncbi:DUF1903-domain-containing protein [Pleurotus eryngii]|uniref:Cx9C motif-containing protein 4, mitochondrial n=1 Tax=Pleurotus eryngii TaxID=5323 RepID=A0A9P6D0T0_PLEER|nr:DUF1903-domain-containing protein [Pleurotus eryngii]
MHKSPEACQTEACDLQSCLGKNTYTPEKCDHHLKRLYLCCQKIYREGGDKAQSTACPQSNVVTRWLKDHP